MLSDVQPIVDNLVRDANSAGGIARLTAGSRDQAIGLAVKQYSKDRPRRLVSDVVVASTSNEVTPPALWSSLFGDTTLEYPIGEVPPRLIDGDRWQVYRKPSGLVFQLWESLPAGAVVRVEYSVEHTLDAVTDTIPVADREALSSYAAAVLLEQLASAASADGDPTISVDSVSRQPSKSTEYANRAAAFRTRYHQLLGIDPKRLKGSSAMGAGADRASWGSARLLKQARR